MTTVQSPFSAGATPTDPSTPLWNSVVDEHENPTTVIATGWRAWALVALILAAFVALIVLGVTTAGTSGLPVALTMWMLAIIGGVATIAAVKEAEK